MPDPEPKPADPDQSPWCFYSTDGDVLGPIERRHLETIWRSGQFPSDAVGFDPAKEIWTPLNDWFAGEVPKIKSETPAADAEKKFRLPPPEMAPLPPSRNHHGRPRKGSSQKILKWQVLSILALLVAVLVGVAMHVRTDAALAERDRFKERIESLEAQLQERTESLERLSENTGEVLSPDQVKGRLALSANDGSAVAQQGVKVLLYNRRDLERYLEQSLQNADVNSDAAQAAVDVVNNLPFPLATTTTDSKGNYEFRLQAPGEFVLHTNILQTPGGPMLWFLGFNSTEPPYTRIDFTDSNRSTSLVPGLIVVPAR